MKLLAAVLPLVLLAAPASSEVVSAGANGFVIRHVAELPAPPQRAFAAFGQLPRWWNPDHSYSGKAANLRLVLAPGGCFCERLPGGGIEHMRVALVQPGERVVLVGALGPVLFDAVAGSMDVRFIAGTAGGTRVTMEYKVAGFANGGADKLAPIVDRVLGEQLRRYAGFASAR